MRGMRLSKTSQKFSAESRSFLKDSVDYIHKSLTSRGIARKLVIKTVLLAEETIVLLMQHAPADAVLNVQIRRSMGDEHLSAVHDH